MKLIKTRGKYTEKDLGRVVKIQKQIFREPTEEDFSEGLGNKVGVVGFLPILKYEHLDPTFFRMEAEALASELKGRGDIGYTLEKLRHLNDLKLYFCRAKFGRSNVSEIKQCLAKLKNDSQYGEF